MLFQSRIEGRSIECVLTPDRHLKAPVICFSCMAPIISGEGLARIESIGGYTAIQLPDLEGNRGFEFSLMYENPDFAPANRAWLPLGVHIRCDGETISIDTSHTQGVYPGAITYPEGITPELRLCPQPSEFRLTGSTVNVSSLQPQNHPELQNVAALMVRTQLGQFFCGDGHPFNVLQDAKMPSEAYHVDISKKEITITYGDSAGLFYAGITLGTMMHTHAGQLPCGVIKDQPRFEWRGQHLDCARHFYSVDTILRLLDLMSLLKLNRFHWHFADDEAFRLEISALPELERTHFRGDGELVPGVFGAGPKAGGGYTKKDACRVIEHAKSLQIEVMPEIEVPAHAYALCKLFPETRDPAETGSEQSIQGYLQNAMNPAMPKSWEIWETMVDEIAALFPFELLHIGGDELPPNTWLGSPSAQKFMKEEGLDTFQDLQGWTMNRLAKYLVDKGKAVGAWEESALGSPSIENNAVIFSWTGQGPGLRAARQGHRVVMMPGQHTYFDMAQSDSREDWGANWAAIIGLEDTINWDPVPDAEPELENNIIGIEGAFWSEFTTRDSEMEPMVAPRILGLATKSWQNKNSQSKDTLFGLRRVYENIFVTGGWQQS